MSHLIEKALRVASRQVDRNPSEAQKEAGNYQKGHVRISGLNITIENPKGSERSGIDKNGKRWWCTLPATYGYLKSSEGADGDHVDCYIGDDHNSDRVFIVDQIDAETGKFDEHKCFLSFRSKDSVLSAYKKAFSDGKGKDRIGGVTEMGLDQFKDWLKHGNTKQPLTKGFASGGRVAAFDFERTDGMSPKEREQKLGQAVALALQVARRGKADGGGILQDVETNPHGLGAAPVVSNYEPTWRDRVALVMRRLMGNDQRMMSPDEERVVTGITGATGAGHQGSSILDFVPGVGQVTLGADALESIDRGNYPLAAFQVGAMGIPNGLGKGAARLFRNADLSAIYPAAMSEARTAAQVGEAPSVAWMTKRPEFLERLPAMEERANWRAGNPVPYTEAASGRSIPADEAVRADVRRLMESRPEPNYGDIPYPVEPATSRSSTPPILDSFDAAFGNPSGSLVYTDPALAARLERNPDLARSLRAFNDSDVPPIEEMHAKGGRVGKADGGILDAVESNPHGWMDGPALSSPNAIPAWQSPAARREALIDALTAHDAISQPDRDIVLGTGKAVRDFTLSPFDMASEGGESLARASSPSQAIPSLAEIGLAAAPGLGPMGSALSTAMKYAPKSTAAALALLGATTFPAAAEGTDPLATLYADREGLTRRITDAAQQRDMEARSGKGPHWQAANSEVDRLQTQKDALDQMIRNKEQENSPEHQQDLAQRQRDIDEANAKAELDKPFAERHPYISSALTMGAPVVSGLLSHYGMRSIAGKGEKLVQDLADAKAAGDVGAMADAAAKLDYWNNPARLYSKQAASFLLPATVPMDVRTAADVFDKYSLPDDSKAQQAASEKLSDIPSYLRDSAQAGLSGLIWSGIGAKAAQIAKAAPRGDASAMLSRYGDKTPDELSDLLSSEAAASSRAQGPLASMAAAQTARNEGRLDAFQGFGGPDRGPLGPDLGPSPTSSPSLTMPVRLPTSGPAATGLPSSMLSEESAGRAPEVSRALDVARRSAKTPASSPVFSPDDLTSDKASKILQEFKKEGVRQWQLPDGSVIHKVAPGSPEGGQFTSAPKPSTKTPKAKGKTNLSVVEDVPVDPATGIPIKPPKDIDPNGPGNFQSGGAIRSALDLARKYARGGAVIGPIIGDTGGRADARDADVPANSYVWPADVVAGRGQGNTESGQKFLARLEQHVVQRMGNRALPMQAHKANGGHVPIRIADGERVTPPEVVYAFGNGDMEQGNRVLDALVKQFRAEDINTLKNLPGPSR